MAPTPGNRFPIGLAAALLVTALVVGLGWRIKAQCLDADWSSNFPFTHLCYTDVQALYPERIASGLVPYTQQFNEYPVLTGLMMHVTGRATADIGSFVAVNSALLGMMAIGVTWMLGHLVPTRRLVWWAAAPALLLYATYNWDLLAVALCTAALLAYSRSRWLAAGALLGLGAAAKLYPAFLAPALGLWLLDGRLRLNRNAWTFGLAFVGAWTAVNLPFALPNPGLWWQTYQFQLGREPNFETLWYVLGHVGRSAGSEDLASFGSGALPGISSLALFLGAVVVSCHLSFTRRLPAVEAATLPVLAFLAFNKVLSVQYVLWVLPLLLLGRFTPAQRAAVLAADVAVYVALFTFYAFWPQVNDAAIFLPVVLATLARCGVYAWLLAQRVRAGYTTAPGTHAVAPATPVGTAAHPAPGPQRVGGL